MKTTQSISFICLAVSASIAGCDRGPQLEPAEFANEALAVDNAVEASQGGVRVVAQAKDWPGEAEIYEEVTPLRVIIHNNSQQPLKVLYSDFELKTKGGTTYSAVPPVLATGVVEQEPEYVEPAFEHDNFYVAPYYGATYAGIPAYTGPFTYDPVFYDTHYGYWKTKTALPTSEMLRRALPEGVVEPGGRVDGFLYFERVDDSQEGQPIWLAARLNSTESANSAQQAALNDAEPVADLTMAFMVK